MGNAAAATGTPQAWSAGLTIKHWRVLTASFLGWVFDGYETFALLVVLPFALCALLNDEGWENVYTE